MEPSRASGVGVESSGHGDSIILGDTRGFVRTYQGKEQASETRLVEGVPVGSWGRAAGHKRRLISASTERREKKRSGRNEPKRLKSNQERSIIGEIPDTDLAAKARIFFFSFSFWPEENIPGTALGVVISQGEMGKSNYFQDRGIH